MMKIDIEKEKEIEEKIKDIWKAINEIEEIKQMKANIHKRIKEREKEILGISDECKTIKELEEYEKVLDEKGKILNSDKILNELNDKNAELIKQEWIRYKRISDILKGLDINIPPIWVFLRFKDIRRIVKEWMDENELLKMKEV